MILSVFSLCSLKKKKKVTANLRQKLLLEALKEEAKANKAPSKPAQVKPAATKGKGLV